MYIEFEKIKKHFHLLKSAFAIVFVALLIALQPKVVMAQGTPVSVSVSVMPPFTSSLYDYIDTPNKIVITLTHTQLSAPDVELYLRATITSEKGIKITTQPGYKPSAPIILGRGKTYILNLDNISEAFNIKHTTIEGTDLNELLNGAGLPEDYYQICVQAFDYNTDQPLSADQPIGCSNLFNIVNIDPPTITLPACGDSVRESTIQLVQFVWAIPPGALRGTIYHFEMVEIPENSTIDPREAFATSKFPVFYEETTSVSTLLLTVQKVLLSPGYTYAFRVRAEDPTGKIYFRNGGNSEVCSFVYGEVAKAAPQFNMSNKQIRFISPKDCSTDSILMAMPSTGFYTSWRLDSIHSPIPIDQMKRESINIKSQLKLKSDSKTYDDPLADYPGYTYRVEFFNSENAHQPIFTTTTDQPFFQADPTTTKLPFVSGQPYWIQVSIEKSAFAPRSDMKTGLHQQLNSIGNSSPGERILTSERCGFKYIYSAGSGKGTTSHSIKGNLRYLFEKQGATSYPVASSQIKLNCRYMMTDSASGKQFEVPESDVLNQLSQAEQEDTRNANSTFSLTAVPVATTVTDDNGNFAFNYSWPDNLPLGKVLLSFSYNADMDGILTGSVERLLKIEVSNPYYESPQKIISLNQASLDMGEVITNVNCYELKATLSKGYKMKLGFTEDMTGKTIYIFRKKNLPGLPTFEGDKLPHQVMNIPPEIKSAGYYLVASGKAEAATNDKGDKVSVASFPRLIENIINGDEYYWYVEGYGLTSAQSFSFGGQWSANTNSGELSDVKVTNTGQSSFLVDASFTILSNDPPMSGIKGRLVYEFPGKPGNARPLANRSISVVSCLVTDEPNGVSKIVKNKWDESNSDAFPWDHVLATKQTDGDGNFNFEFPNIDYESPDPKKESFQVSTGKLNRNETWVSWESDPGKEFRITYAAAKSIKVKRVFRVVVNDQTGLFMSPDDNLQINPLETVDVGTLTSNVMSYCLKGSVIGNNPKSDLTGISDQIYVSTEIPIKGAECYILRLISEVNGLQLPSDEGQNIIGSLDEKPFFKIVGLTTTDSQGKFSFDNLLFRNAQAPIYLYCKTEEMLGTVNFKPVMVNQNSFNPFARPFYLFNSDYNYTTISGFGAVMDSKNATIKGKVSSNISAGIGVSQATCELVPHFSNMQLSNFGFGNNPSYIQKSDFDGYFDFTPFFEKFAKEDRLKNLVTVDVIVSKNGFHYMENGVRKASYKITLPKADFELGKQTILPVTLYGDGTIRGTVVNENGYPVDAYVQFLENRLFDTLGGEGDMAKTEEAGGIWGQIVKGTFNIPAIPGINRKLVVIPKDVTYFSDTLTFTVNETGDTDRGNIKVFERMHRIAFQVMTQEKVKVGNVNSQQPIKGGRVELIGSPNPVIVYASNFGIVTMNFKNVSETNLSLRVSGPDGSSFIPKEISFTNYESDKVVQLPTVYLEQGITLKGKVLLDGNPTSEAEVYVDLSTTQTFPEDNKTSQGVSAIAESQHLFKAYPKADGTFEINTIPPELNGKKIIIKTVYKKAVSSPVRALGIKKTSGALENSTVDAVPTVVGDEKLVTVPDASDNLVLNMKTFANMQITDVWGFPLEITKIVPQQTGNNVYVSGRVKLDGYCPGFDPLESLTLEVNSVEFKPSAQLNNGVPVGIPSSTNVTIDMKRLLKLKYAKAFNVKLTAPGNNTLSILKNSDGTSNGSVNATVAIVDNSFQYPSSYLNFNQTNFNFCNKLDAGNSFSMNPVIKVFSSAKTGNGNDIVKFNLCNLGDGEKADSLKFNFINFKTTASAASSTIEGSEISLDATLDAQIKDAGKIKVKIGKLVLKNDAIAAVSGNTPIIIELKDGGIYDKAKAWTFEARNWRIDPKVGGLISENCILHTGSIDIPYSYFNLRNDFAYLGNPDKNNINIGGYPIAVQSEANVVTGYNPSCGGDKKGHWQLIFFPNAKGETPALVNDLPNMGGLPLQLETVSLLSNGENVFSIGTGAKPMRLYNTVDFKPQTVSSLTDGFVLNGTASFHIPRVRNEIGVNLTFVKNAAKPSNPKFDPINLDFEGKGNIKFTTMPGQAFDPDPLKRTFTTFGTMQEPGVLKPIEVKLTYFDNEIKDLIRTEIVESKEKSALTQKVNIGENENTHLENVTCRTKADQNEWDLFVFEGDLTGAVGVSAPTAKTNNHMKFTVYGEIKGEKDKFKADGIDKPFDGMQITYQNGGLIGTLTMTNFPLGSSIVNGVANIRMDSDGWAFYANCRASNVPAPDPCSVYMGILIGNYKTILPEMKSTVLAYALNKEMPRTFTDDGLKGFYMVGGRELPLSGLDIGINVVVASAYVRVPVAAIDASYYMNFAGPSTIGMGLTGKIALEFGLGSITCTDLTGGIDAIVFVTGDYSKGGLSLTGGADFNLTLHVSQGIPYLVGCIDAIDIPVSVNGGFKFGVNPTDVKFHLGK